MSLPYIINAALVLAACLAFYKLLLRRETFYKVNRYVLVVCLFVSFALPLLTVPEEFSLRKKDRETVTDQPTVIKRAEQVQQQSSNEKSVVNPPAAGDNQSVDASSSGKTRAKEGVGSEAVRQKAVRPGRSDGFSLLNWIITIYWFGVIVFAASFLFQFIVLIWRAFRNPVIKDGQYRIVDVSGDKAPCSFGNIIFINPEKYEWD